MDWPHHTSTSSSAVRFPPRYIAEIQPNPWSATSKRLERRSAGCSSGSLPSLLYIVAEELLNPECPADSSRVELAAIARELSKRELVRYVLRTGASERAMARAERVLPLGVASSFQFYEPHPLVMRAAAGSHMTDLDGYEYVDFTMGYGSLFTGHGHPVLSRVVSDQVKRGALFVSPCE